MKIERLKLPSLPFSLSTLGFLFGQLVKTGQKRKSSEILSENQNSFVFDFQHQTQCSTIDWSKQTVPKYNFIKM